MICADCGKTLETSLSGLPNLSGSPHVLPSGQHCTVCDGRFCLSCWMQRRASLREEDLPRADAGGLQICSDGCFRRSGLRKPKLPG